MRKLLAILASLALSSAALASDTVGYFNPGPAGPVQSNGTYKLVPFTGCSAGVPLLSWTGACVVNGGGGTPGGANFTTQYNNGGAFGGVGPGTTTTVLHGNASAAPAFSAVSLTADVSNILPGANGGTNNGFMAFAGPATSLKTFTLPNASANVLTDNAAVTVPQGGTGVGTFTAHGILIGEGTGNIVATAALAADNLLLGQGAADPAAVALVNCGDATHALAYSTGTHTFACQAITGSGGSPATPTSSVQFNNAGAFGGDAGFEYVGGATQNITLGTATVGETIKGTTGSSNGPTMAMTGAQGAATSAGGGLTFTAGSGGATSGTGGTGLLQGGAATGGATASSVNLPGANSGGNGGGAFGGAYAGNGIGSGAGGNFLVNFDIAGSGGITGGLGGATGNGGNISMTAGKGGATSGNGGQANFQGGSAVGGGQGGAVQVIAGNGVGANLGGAMQITAGNGGATGTGGAITLSAGSAGSSTTGGNGGAITITAGAPGAAATQGGPVQISAGNGSTTGAGAIGSAVTLTAGNAGGSGNNAGGNVVLQAGTATGSGAVGIVSVASPATFSSDIKSAGTKFTLGTGTGACATSSTLVGGAVAGSFVCTGTAGASTQIINFPTVTNGYSCAASDATSGVAWATQVGTASTGKIAGTITTTSDVVVFHCIGY